MNFIFGKFPGVPVAQWIARWTSNPEVAGSNPAGDADFFFPSPPLYIYIIYIFFLCCHHYPPIIMIFTVLFSGVLFRMVVFPDALLLLYHGFDLG